MNVPTLKRKVDLSQDRLPVIRYGTLDISKCEVEVTFVRDSNKGRSRKVKRIFDHKNGIVIHPTERFWTSLFREYQMGSPSEQFFNYFPYDEIFNRIKSVTNSPLSAICLEHVKGTTNQFNGYGISRNNTQTRFDDVIGVLSKKVDDMKEFEFRNGVVITRHRSKEAMANFSVAGDEYNGYFSVETPIDGLGTPVAYIGSERLVCTNGITAYNPTFRSQFKVAENGVHTLETILDGFRNEEGFIQLKRRFENADLSFLSMREASKISDLFSKLNNTKNNPDPKLSGAIYKFSDMLGSFNEELGIVSLGQVSEKVAASIPMRPTVLSMIQLLSECSTHYLIGEGALKVQKFLGTLISGNYDMELSKKVMGEYDAFLASR